MHNINPSMMLIRIYFFILIISYTITSHAFPSFEPLTEKQCQAYIFSNDRRKMIYAYFACPRNLQAKYRTIKSTIAKR
ncbi:unnamed protein product [Adineta ricciae]|uniref:Uncharacterized protein n=1 Tax=Adineta ricciae TaxID=249248 RepID=A0A813QNL9_ADIRI|nr:unnamed protein product [Adineta ricciae]